MSRIHVTGNRMRVIAAKPTCEYCGQQVPDLGEGYYDHLRKNKSCEAAWRTWRENLIEDHPGGD